MSLAKVGVIILLFYAVHEMDAATETAPKPRRRDNSLFVIKLSVNMRKASRTPYAKFRYNYVKVSACNLRYYQKYELCLQILTSNEYDASLVTIEEELADLSCRRIVIDASDKIKTIESKKVVTAGYQCPRAYREEPAYEDDSPEPKFHKFFLPVHFHITGGVYQQTVIVNYQHAGYRTKIKPSIVVFGIPLGDFSYMLNQVRDQKYTRQPDFYFKGLTQSKIRRLTGSEPPLLRTPVDAEVVATQNNEIKRMAPYEKFKKTYNILNICSLKMIEKLDCCRQVFENQIYKLLLNENEGMFCERQKVAVNFMPERKFDYFQLTVIQCPVWEWGTVNSYFVAMSFQGTQLIGFLQIHSFPEILPDAITTTVETKSFVTKIQKKTHDE